MKKTLFIIALLAANLEAAFAQFEQGTVEMSLTGTAGYQKVSVSGGSTSSSSSESLGYLYLNTTFGYYLTDGLSLEPQLGTFLMENEPPSESILLNLSYTKPITNTSVALFCRIGYGLGNAISYVALGMAPLRMTNDWDVQIFNMGGGLKILVAENIALRAELNYRSETYDLRDVLYSNTSSDIEYTFSNTALLFGFSVLL
jgi:opacity protein-like surface antigen